MDQSSMRMLYFFIFNALYLGVGVTMLGYGISSVIDMQQYGSFSQNSFVAGAAIFIAVGALKMIFSVIGMIATFIHKKPLFAVYVAFVIFLMFWTFIAAIYGFQTRNSAYATTEARLMTAYTPGNNNTADLLTVQNNLNCCGVGDPTDADMAGIPCNSTRRTDNLYGQGCLQYLGLVFVEQLYDIGALGVAFGVFEGTSLLIAMQHVQG